MQRKGWGAISVRPITPAAVQWRVSTGVQCLNVCNSSWCVTWVNEITTKKRIVISTQADKYSSSSLPEFHSGLEAFWFWTSLAAKLKNRLLSFGSIDSQADTEVGLVMPVRRVRNMFHQSRPTYLSAQTLYRIYVSEYSKRDFNWAGFPVRSKSLAFRWELPWASVAQRWPRTHSALKTSWP